MGGAFHGAGVLTLDAKGRLAIPTRHRETLVAARKPVILTAHPDGCALLYPESEWDSVRAQVEKFPSFYPQASWWKRLLLGFEEHVVPDNSGRILISPALRMHAKLEREVMMVGQGRYFELWDSGVWGAKRDGALAAAANGTPPPGMEGFSL
jgi:MraZ protein